MDRESANVFKQPSFDTNKGTSQHPKKGVNKQQPSSTTSGLNTFLNSLARKQERTSSNSCSKDSLAKRSKHGQHI